MPQMTQSDDDNIVNLCFLIFFPFPTTRSRRKTHTLFKAALKATAAHTFASRRLSGHTEMETKLASALDHSSARVITQASQQRASSTRLQSYTSILDHNRFSAYRFL